MEKLVECCREEIAVQGKNFFFERVDSAQITLGLFGKFILLGYGVMAMTLLVAKGPEIEAVEDGQMWSWAEFDRCSLVGGWPICC